MIYNNNYKYKRDILNACCLPRGKCGGVYITSIKRRYNRTFKYCLKTLKSRRDLECETMSAVVLTCTFVPAGATRDKLDLGRILISGADIEVCGLVSQSVICDPFDAIGGGVNTLQTPHYQLIYLVRRKFCRDI